MTCLAKRREACRVLEDREASPEQVAIAKSILNEEVCSGCSNPLTVELSLDDLMCDNKG